MQFFGPHPQSFWFTKSGVGTKNFTFNQFLVNVDPADLGTTLLGTTTLADFIRYSNCLPWVTIWILIN